jgi:ribosomal protein L37AE/L43A
MTYDHWKTMSDRDERDRVDPEEPAAFTCPRCGWTTHNCHDARARYCGHCHVFVDDGAGPGDLRQRQ